MRMIDKSDILTSLKAAFTQTFFAQITDVNTMENDCLQPDECGLASLDFSGDYAGEMLMSLKKPQVQCATQYVLQKFGIDVPMQPEIIFTEILNICAGRMSIEMEKYGAVFHITAPKNQWDFPSGQTPVSYAADIATDQGFSIKFCFYLRN